MDNNNEQPAQPKDALRELRPEERIEATDEFSDGITVQKDFADGTISRYVGWVYQDLLDYFEGGNHWRLFRKDTDAPTNP